MVLPFAFQSQKLLSTCCTFGIGGPARYYAEAFTTEEMEQMVLYASKQGIDIFILGKGSNTLFDDRGFDGLVIANKIDYLKNGEEGHFRAGGGYSFARLGQTTARMGWSGLEFASGIPATVGGAVFMNAGANGQETADTLKEVIYLKETGELVLLQKNQLTFRYRESPFQSQKGVIIEAHFFLTPSEEVKKDQKRLLDYRLKTQPYGEKSAGCAFRNPKPHYAGQLIEACGLKGMHVGGASISTTHANFIVNRGGAKSQDVLDLIQKIKDHIYLHKQIILEEEIRYIPYSRLS